MLKYHKLNNTFVHRLQMQSLTPTYSKPHFPTPIFKTNKMPSSSSVQNAHQRSLLKPLKSVVFPTIKRNSLLSLFFKTSLAVCFFFFFFYLSLSYYNYHHSPFHHSTIFEYSELTSIRHVVFGIASSIKTWRNRHHYTELWWRPNVTRGFTWLDEDIPTNEVWPETLPLYKVSGNTSSFKYTCSYGSRHQIRMGRILKETFELGLENVRWFVIGDDDTVFFTENLITVLSKYDHNEMYYIGGNSESVEQNLIHSYGLAYGGGGGFAVSYPLAAVLVKIFDGCIDCYASLYGASEKVHSCVSEIGVPITKELGFHQIDLRGYLYGLLAAHPLAALVSLHHFDSVKPLFPNTTRLKSLEKLVSAYKTNLGRTLQQSICYDARRNWTISVSWGYSVHLYPSIQTPYDLQTPFRTFQTWRSWSNEPFTFNTRPVNFDICNGPLWFFLDRVENLGEEGRTRSAYKRHDVLSKYLNCTAPTFEVQYVNVVASHFMPEMWKKAPRRQCCDIIKGADEASNGIQVEIRDCHHFESVTPP